MLARGDDAEFGRKARELLQKVARARELNNYASALSVFGHLLIRAHMRDEADWIWELSHAYGDLEYGRLDRILTPKKTGSRPPDASIVWGARARVAAVAKLLALPPGWTRRRAAEEIARRFPELKHLAEPEADLVKSISSWRDEFAKDRVKNKFGRYIYKSSMDDLRLCLPSQDGTKEKAVRALWEESNEFMGAMLRGAARQARKLAKDSGET
jgi:hypothetical protein